MVRLSIIQILSDPTSGDSWRARVSHMCEIQVNLSSGAIRIDFGGLDRWDFIERSRNVLEAERE